MKKLWLTGQILARATTKHVTVAWPALYKCMRGKERGEDKSGEEREREESSTHTVLALGVSFMVI